MADNRVSLTDKDTIIAVRSLKHEPLDIQVVAPEDPQKKEYMVWYFAAEVEPVADDWQRFVNGLPTKEERPEFEHILNTINASKSFQNCWYALIKQKNLRN